MYKARIIISFLLFAISITGDAQSTGTPKKKKGIKVVKAHRGTLVLNIHDKVNRQAQAKYAALPKVGSIVASLPGNAITVVTGANSYYYKNGLYYSQTPKGYVVVIPSAGVRLHGLPITYRRVPLNSKVYFYYFGTFYMQVGNSDDYEVIDAPEGAIVDALPDGYQVKKVDNTEYYFIGGVYYGEVDAPNMQDKVGYEVVTIIEEYEIQ